MKRFAGTMLMLVFSLAWTSLSSESQGLTRTVTVRGTVVDARQGAPIEGALVSNHADPGQCEWAMWTGSDGTFSRRCEVVGEGSRIRVRVDRDGFRPWTWIVDVNPDEIEGDDIVLDVRLEDLAAPGDPEPSPTPSDELLWSRFSGHVYAEGRPTAMARVAVSASVGRESCFSPVQTDTNGYFEVWCYGGHSLWGSVRMTVEADGFLTYDTGRISYQELERIQVIALRSRGIYLPWMVATAP